MTYGKSEKIFMVKLAHPPTQRELAANCGVSLGSVNKIISGFLKAKLRKKCHVHGLRDTQILKRRARSLRLCLRLIHVRVRGKWGGNVVTTDEVFL